MTISRTFLNWNQPCLTQAADWLLKHAAEPDCPDGSGSVVDLSGVTVVTPGSRAGRRLLELLVDKTAGLAMVPPRIVTLGRLPEILYRSEKRTPGELAAWAFRAQAMRQVPADVLADLLPHPPRADDPLALLSQAREIHQLADELATHQLTFEDIARRIEDLMDTDHERWSALAQIDQQYHDLLISHDLVDVHKARQAALTSHQLAHNGPIVLVAVTDLPAEPAAMLEALTSRVDILIHADETESENFDALGRPITSRWADRTSDLDPEHVHLVQRPSDQAYQLPRILQQIDPLPRPDQITIGLGDPALASQIERTLKATAPDVPVRLATGKTIDQSLPAIVLKCVAELLSRQTTRELAQALRCPPIEARVRQTMGHQGQCLLHDLDSYIDKHLSRRLSDVTADNSPGSAPTDDSDLDAQNDRQITQTVITAWQTLLGLLPASATQRAPLASWREPIAQLLETFFGQRDLERFDPDDALLIRAIKALADALDEHAQVPHDLDVLGQLTLAETLKLLLMQVASQLLPPDAGEPAIELLGWLELQLDDAPYLMITGVNEGQIPKNITNHWLLPDTLRSRLGLPDNQQRYVRDLYMLKAIVHSTQQVDIVAGRTNSRGEPLAPSRLLLAAEPAELPGWIERFYGREHASTPHVPLLLVPGVKKTFEVPRPLPLEGPVTSLRVTAFRDYLACPYRFYLKNILKLSVLDDRAVELDAKAFGTLAHKILKAMGHHAAGDSSDPAAIEAMLTDKLAKQISSRFGKRPPAVIRIQQEILNQRFREFALWQAQNHRDGWRIDQTLLEHKLERELMVDGQPFTIHGTIDRCDHHPELGHRLLDYKTSDTANPPGKTHRKRDGTWIDLQLPLYHYLAGSLDMPMDRAVGYINLPGKIEKIGCELAPWTPVDLESALQCAADVIRKIRQEIFWPPTSKPHEDEFAGICMVHCLNEGPVATEDQTAEKTS